MALNLPDRSIIRGCICVFLVIDIGFKWRTWGPQMLTQVFHSSLPQQHRTKSFR